jgi:hypothetical protein
MLECACQADARDSGRPSERKNPVALLNMSGFQTSTVTVSVIHIRRERARATFPLMMAARLSPWSPSGQRVGAVAGKAGLFLGFKHRRVLPARGIKAVTMSPLSPPAMV